MQPYAGYSATSAMLLSVTVFWSELADSHEMKIGKLHIHLQDLKVCIIIDLDINAFIRFSEVIEFPGLSMSLLTTLYSYTFLEACLSIQRDVPISTAASYPLPLVRLSYGECTRTP